MKFIASQAYSINQYKNTRLNILKCCSDIYFNRKCLETGVIPKYAQIKVPYTSPASTHTQKKMQLTRVKDEIKYLHKKKDILNKSLYKLHLKAANEWGNTWHMIRESTHAKMNQEFEHRYKILDNKLSN
jgi:hypothetical protein